MKIVHCINSPHIGGIERLVIELAIEQKKQGLEVSIMLDTRKGQYAEYLFSQNIPILDSGIKNGFDISRTTFKTLKETFNNFQIVHLHSFSPIRSKAAKQSQAKVVYTIHGLSKEVRKENIIKYTLREILKKYALNRVDCFIANSQSTLSKAKSHYGLKNTKSTVVLNGVSMPALSSNDLLSKNSEFTIGMVSRFTPRKRIDRLIVAFNSFLKQGGKGRLVLVGDGINFEDIKNQIQKLELKNDVDLVGYSNEVDKYYKNFDVCVQPSDNEGFGLVAVEAYLYGLPILVFNDSGGLKEVVAPLELENIVETEAKLAERFIWCSENLDKIKQDSEKRRQYAQNNFAIERMERDYYNVYKNLI